MRTLFSNYIILKETNETVAIEIIRADAKNPESEEIGFMVSGVAVTFDVRNENGGIFQTGDFDKSVRNYFRKNKINMVCPIEHADGDFDNRGIFKSVENTAGELLVSVEFYKDCCSKYETIKNQIKRGILQGFSSFGWINDVDEATLINISLVANPADAGAKLFKNTKYIGFDDDNQDEPIIANEYLFL